VTLVGFSLVVVVVALFAIKHSIVRSRTEQAAEREEIREEQADVPEVAAKTILQKTISKNPPRILDFRDAAEYAAFHIPDSYPVTLEKVPELPFREGEEAVIISSDDRTTKEASRALAARDIIHFAIEGGLPAWEAAGGRLINYGDPASVEDLSKVDLVTVEEYASLIRDGSDRHRVLDIRSDGEKIAEDAVWIPLQELESRRDEIPAATNIALCGENGIDAFRAAVRLFDLGIVSVKTLDGDCASLLSEKTEAGAKP